MMSIANAARHSENTCGLDVQSFQTTSNGRAVGEGISSGVHVLKLQGEVISNYAKQSC
jgi:hypothetical protein